MNVIYLIILILIVSINSFAISIENAVIKALENNYALKYKSKLVESKKFEYEASKANRYPSFIFDGKYTLLDDKKTEPFNTPFGAQDITILEKEYFEIFTGFRLNLYTGGLVTSSIEAKSHEQKIEKFKFLEEKNELIFKTKKAYLDILKLYSHKNVLEEYLKSLNKHLSDIKIMYEQGIVPYIDILQTEVKVEEVKQKTIDIENKIDVAKFNLATLMGVDDISFNVEDINNNLIFNLNLENLLRIAEENRAILKSFDENIFLIDSLKGVTKSGFLPKIYIQGGYQYSNSVDEVEPKGNFLIQVGINYTLEWSKPFYETKAKNSMKYALIKYKNDTKLKIFLEVQNAYKSFETAKKNLELAKTQEKKAKEYFRIIDLKYKEGLASNTDLLDANAMLVEAQMNIKNAHYDMLEKYFALEKAIGKELR
ncbi:TolC family protein [Deferribacter thermophilus]|uniref:TolC family protein n=1 Tax=Deferribacter thermophilus TaxID=53573 RepID=UPI003C2443AC